MKHNPIINFRFHASSVSGRFNHDFAGSKMFLYWLCFPTNWVGVWKAEI